MLNAMSSVQRPRRNEITNTIDLINFIALAGGTTADGAMNDEKITRVSDTEERIRWREFQLNLENISKLRYNDL